MGESTSGRIAKLFFFAVLILALLGAVNRWDQKLPTLAGTVGGPASRSASAAAKVDPHASALRTTYFSTFPEPATAAAWSEAMCRVDGSGLFAAAPAAYAAGADAVIAELDQARADGYSCTRYQYLGGVRGASGRGWAVYAFEGYVSAGSPIGTVWYVVSFDETDAITHIE
jgi:hypothetical protein